MKRAVYLKINLNTEYAYRIFDRWIETIYYLNELYRKTRKGDQLDVFILCDKDVVIEQIKQRCTFLQEVYFIKSTRDGEIESTVNAVCSPMWRNAGYAHLTTFQHASRNGYSYFWNIDADDTLFFVGCQNVATILKQAEVYAETHNMDCFSMDMWWSRYRGEAWSFGITYTAMTKDWSSIFENTKEGAAKAAVKETGALTNVDWFFTYLNKNKLINAGSWYVENLRFVHYSEDFIANPRKGGFMHYRNRLIVMPIEYYCLELHDEGMFNIRDDSVMLDLRISDLEAIKQMAAWSKTETHRIYDHFPRSVEKEYVIDQKIKHFFEEKGDFEAIASWGLSTNFYRYEKYFRKLDKYIGTFDNNPKKWGKISELGTKCLSPEKLSDYKNVFIIICADRRETVSGIAESIRKYGITHYSSSDEFMRCYNYPE